MSEETEADAYLLGTDPTELARLGFQHRVWAVETATLWREAGFGPGQSILDVGCGPGFATVDLAQLVSPGGRVTALDRSARFLAATRARAAAEGLGDSVDTREVELAELELEEDAFDGAHARWVLCFLSEPRRLLEQLTRAIRPGGRLVLQDYANYEGMTLTPPCPAFDGIAAAIGESWRRQGGDLDVGGRLATWLTELGWTIRTVRPAVDAAAPGSPRWEWLNRFFRGYLPRVVELGLLEQAALDAFLTAWTKRSSDPGTRFVTPAVMEVVAER